MNKDITYFKFFEQFNFSLLFSYFRHILAASRKGIRDDDFAGPFCLNSNSALILRNRINIYLYFQKSLGSTSKPAATMNRASY